MNDFLHVAPPPDGLHRAFANARTRRLRKASVSTGTVAAAMSVLALVAGGQSTQSLIQQPAPEQPAVQQLVPDDPHQVAPRPNQGRTVQLFGTTQQAGVSQRSADGSALGRGTLGEPLRDERVGPRPAGRPYVAGPLTQSDQPNLLPVDTTCGVGTGQGSQRLCTSASVTSGAGPYSLYADVCSYQASLALLHYPGRNEVDFAITTSKGREVWRWSRWHPDDGAAHTFGLEGEHCASWTFDWPGVDANGHKLPKGDYTFTATFLANELAPQRTRTYALTIS